MLDDRPPPPVYSAVMAGAPAHIVLKLRTREPIEIGHFVSAFTSLAHQYEDFIRENYPELRHYASTFARSGAAQSRLILSRGWFKALRRSSMPWTKF
jgi:hypothetical protein